MLACLLGCLVASLLRFASFCFVLLRFASCSSDATVFKSEIELDQVFIDHIRCILQSDGCRAPSMILDYLRLFATLTWHCLLRCLMPYCLSRWINVPLMCKTCIGTPSVGSRLMAGMYASHSRWCTALRLQGLRFARDLAID